MRPVRALVTNDDGVTSPGIATLARAALENGFDAVVVAPSTDRSGASASLAAVEHEGRVVVGEHPIEGLAVPALGVEAAPAFIVRAAIAGSFGEPPEVVLAGVNHGLNTGHLVLHSGTVGAALTASTCGLPAMAVSLAAGTIWRWDTAVAALDLVLPWFGSRSSPSAVNVNIPAVDPGSLVGLAAARLTRHGTVQAIVSETAAGWVRLTYGAVDGDHEPGSDAALLAAGYVTVTPLLSVSEAPPSDLTGLSLATTGAAARARWGS